jgi:hypothetical protein
MQIDVTQRIGLQNLYFADTHKLFDLKSLIRGNMPDITAYTKGTKDATEGFGYARMALWLGFKHEQKDLFEGASGSDLDDKLSEEAMLELGHLIAYAISHLSCGLYTHAFLIFIFGNKARLFRWDRAGGIVSESFDYVTTRTLAEFFHRFDQSTPEQRGRDTTVTRPSRADRRRAARALLPEKSEDESEMDVNKRKEYMNPESFVKYLVSDSKTGETRRFIGPPLRRPLFHLQGRASRGVPVYDVKTGEVCYLKDTWRIDSSKQLREGETYERLHATKVKNIAGVVAHGDVVAPVVTELSVGTVVGHNWRRQILM